MVEPKQETHRPGVFKQKNKTHKTGRHRSKGAIDREQKGNLNCLHSDSIELKMFVEFVLNINSFLIENPLFFRKNSFCQSSNKA